MNKSKYDEISNAVDKSYELEAETPPELPDVEDKSTKNEGNLNMSNKKRPIFLKKGPLNKKEKLTLLGLVLFIILVAAGLLWWLSSTNFDDNSTTNKKAAVKHYSPLSGIEVADEAATKRVVTAVMIENSPDARPQSGLAEADVVFEAVAEGGITRFIALYQPSRPALIGPVRSLRAYYVDWAAGFDPSVAHVGGSPEALNMIRSGNYGVDIDQFFNASYYWRASDRYAPHNMYTSFDKLDELNKSKNHTESKFAFVPRKNEKAVAEPNATSVSIDVSHGIFSVSYAYNAATNSYDRKQGGEAHTDREKGQISPKVVVALKTGVTLQGDGSHMTIGTTGSGQAYVFQNGTVTEGTWSKADAKGQLFIKDGEGKDISLVRGQTWITVVANERGVSWQ